MNEYFEISIRQETFADFSVVENLTREAFWNVYRPGCLEHFVLHCFRERPEYIPELSFVMERAFDDGRGEPGKPEIIAHVMFAWSEILLETP